MNLVFHLNLTSRFLTMQFRLFTIMDRKFVCSAVLKFSRFRGYRLNKNFSLFSAVSD